MGSEFGYRLKSYARKKETKVSQVDSHYPAGKGTYPIFHHGDLVSTSSGRKAMCDIYNCL